MKVSAETIRNFLNQQQKHISHYVVAHSYYFAYHKQAKDIEAMTFNLQKDLRHARNCFNKELYGNGARRKLAFPRFGRQLILSTMNQGGSDEANQIHR